MQTCRSLFNGLQMSYNDRFGHPFIQNRKKEKILLLSNTGDGRVIKTGFGEFHVVEEATVTTDCLGCPKHMKNTLQHFR
jgi:hypothetical protein